MLELYYLFYLVLEMRRKLIINDKQGEAWQMYMVIAYGYSGYISVLLYNPIGRRGTRG